MIQRLVALLSRKKNCDARWARSLEALGVDDPYEKVAVARHQTAAVRYLTVVIGGDEHDQRATRPLCTLTQPCQRRDKCLSSDRRIVAALC
ncbi:hypothetical protein [Saccharopolyspora spinosa]|uniref:Uncharacterized protein n=1 Tax=Saccharopolyspora spinosa TaxID=60894 RepID=A0A2N3Y1M9_SACSN|nr:hypothetical protein [Saccharopolyspora spinosa]PKW16844.1 hypothetical protein A8926_4738 [Saccharopolyspora spinosa]